MGWFKSRNDDDQARMNEEVRRLLGDERIAQAFNKPAVQNESRDGALGGTVRGRLTAAEPQGATSRPIGLGGASLSTDLSAAVSFETEDIDIHSEPREPRFNTQTDKSISVVESHHELLNEPPMTQHQQTDS